MKYYLQKPILKSKKFPIRFLVKNEGKLKLVFEIRDHINLQVDVVFGEKLINRKNITFLVNEESYVETEIIEEGGYFSFDGEYQQFYATADYEDKHWDLNIINPNDLKEFKNKINEIHSLIEGENGLFVEISEETFNRLKGFFKEFYSKYENKVFRVKLIKENSENKFIKL